MPIQIMLLIYQQKLTLGETPTGGCVGIPNLGRLTGLLTADIPLVPISNDVNVITKPNVCDNCITQLPPVDELNNERV